MFSKRRENLSALAKDQLIERVIGLEESIGKTTLETGGEDVKPHSTRVEKMHNHTQNECNILALLKKENSRLKFNFNLSGNPLRNLFKFAGVFSTRFECSLTSSPLVSSVVSDLLHSIRV